MKKTICALSIAAALLGTSFESEAIVTSTGSSPDCSGAAASLGVIWPPDHKMVAINIVGVTDPYNLPIGIVVDSIMQDEPVEVAGSGNTAPDGTGIGTSTAWVRAERAGPGTGRIYVISFTATNSQGNTCTGAIQAFVPHDQGQGFQPTDTGQRYDSTATL